MSGFVIFAIVLTFVYVVYFAVMITLDLHGKKDEKKSEEETYDVGDMTNEEQPVAIEERNDNPDEGDMTFIEQITDDGLRVVNPTGNVTPHSSFIEERNSHHQRQVKNSTRKTMNSWSTLNQNINVVTSQKSLCRISTISTTPEK